MSLALFIVVLVLKVDIILFLSSVASEDDDEGGEGKESSDWGADSSEIRRDDRTDPGYAQGTEGREQTGHPETHRPELQPRRRHEGGQ